MESIKIVMVLMEWIWMEMDTLLRFPAVMIVMIVYGCFTRQNMFNKCTTDGLDASRLTGKITD